MIVALKELGDISTGNTPSKKVSEYYDSDDIYFVKPDIISDTEISIISNSSEYISEKATPKPIRRLCRTNRQIQSSSAESA